MNGGLLGYPGLASAPGSLSTFDIWRTSVLAAGGGLTSSSETVASRLAERIASRTYAPKIIYLLPFLGADVTAATVPLVDIYRYGRCTNVNMGGGDFSESTGLQGNASNKYFIAPLGPYQLGPTTGGMGWWENNFVAGGSNTEATCWGDGSPDNRFTLDLRNTRRFFSWGHISTGIVNQNISASNGNWYGQKLSTTSRRFFLNGALLTSSAVSDSAIPSAAGRFDVCGANYNGSHTPYSGRGACCYYTSGLLTDAEVLDLHNDLYETLIQPLGR